MSLEESFYRAWLDTKEKALRMFSCQAYFSNENDREKFDTAIEFITNSLETTFHNSVQGLEHVESTSIVKCFNKMNLELQDLKNKVVEEFGNECWIDYPISILSNFQSYLLDNFLTEFNQNKTKQKTKFSNLKKAYSIINNFFTKKDEKFATAEETYKQLTLTNIYKMMDELKLASIQIMDDVSWYKKFLNIQQIYNAIKESHKRIGLPVNNLGANRKLNLIISESFLNEQKWSGIQSKTNASFSIFLTPSPVDINKTWIHEYTHFLDRLAAHVYYQENKTDEELSSFSHIALNAVVNQNPIHNIALNIMAETMSATIGGVSSREFASKIQKSIKDTKDNITKKILIEILPEKESTWNTLEPSEKQTLLHHTRIPEVTDFIMLEVSNHPKATFNLNDKDTLVSIEGENVTISNLFVPDVIHSIYEKINTLDPFVMHSNLLEYIKESLAEDVTSIMNSHNLYIYKDHSIYDDRFFISPGNDLIKQAQDAQKSDSDITFSYYDKPLELLARMVESLQNPLMTNYDYKNLELITKKDFACPILSREERMMICATIQSVARYVGIDVPQNELDQLPCVSPEKIDEAFQLPINDISDFKYANTNQLIPDEVTKKEILTHIFKNREDLFEIQPVVAPKRKT